MATRRAKYQYRRPGYRAAVEWIADNDDSSRTEFREVVNTITVRLVAELWGGYGCGATPDKVAADVLACRGGKMWKRTEKRALVVRQCDDDCKRCRACDRSRSRKSACPVCLGGYVEHSAPCDKRAFNSRVRATRAKARRAKGVAKRAKRAAG